MKCCAEFHTRNRVMCATEFESDMKCATQVDSET